MYRMCLRISALVILIGYVFILPAYAAYPQTVTTTTPFVNIPRPKDDPRWAQAFGHWDKRGSAKEVQAAITLFESLAKDHPDQVEARLWVARSYYMRGMRLRGDEQKAWMKKTVAAADRVLELDPGNEFARYWRYCSQLLYHEFTPEDFAEIRKFGAKYKDLRELPVPGDDLLWANAIKHWDRRINREDALKAIAVFESLEKKYPDRIEPKLWLLRSNYYMHYIEPESEGKAKWCKIAADWGDKALAIEPRNPAANYLKAASLGQYGTHTSFVNMARYSLEITNRLMLVMEEDPNYFYGGVSQYFALAIARAGTLVARMLGLMGFTEELIMRSTQFAANYEPRYLRNHYALGEMYITLGQMDEAKKALEKVVNADPSELENMEAENIVAQDLAKKLLKEKF